MKKLGELSLSQYIAKVISISNWGAGAFFAIYGILVLILPTTLNSLAATNPMFSAFFGGASDIASKFTGLLGGFLLFCAIYSFLVAYGFGAYKNYARIMLLIPLYIFAGVLALGLIPVIILLFTMPLVGLFFLILFAFYGFILFLSIYLFQKQKDMVALFKGQ